VKRQNKQEVGMGYESPTVKTSESAEAVKTLIDLGRKTVGVQTFPRRRDGVNDQQQFVVIPADHKVELLVTLPASEPDRIRCVVQVVDLQSFLRYVNEHKDETTRVFASVLKAPFGLTAALDYHDAENIMASFVEHLCKMEFTPTDQWSLWSANDRKVMDQQAFALFIEENQPDIIQPSGADMLELAKSIEATQEVQFKRQMRLDNGDVKFLFEDKTEATAGMNGALAIPQLLTLNIPIFLGMPVVNVPCRFRHRLEGGKMKIWYEIIRRQELLLKIAQSALDIVEQKTLVPYFLGTYTNQQ